MDDWLIIARSWTYFRKVNVLSQWRKTNIKAKYYTGNHEDTPLVLSILHWKTKEKSSGIVLLNATHLKKNEVSFSWFLISNCRIISEQIQKDSFQEYSFGVISNQMLICLTFSNSWENVVLFRLDMLLNINPCLIY